MSAINRGKRKEAAHVDDTSRVEIGSTILSSPICGSPKEWQAFLGEGEHSVEVQRQDFGPSLVLNTPRLKVQPPSREYLNTERTYGVSVELVSPNGSSVVDEDVKCLFLGRDLAHEPVDLGELLHVGGDWNAFSGTESVELFGGFFAVFGRSGRDVNLQHCVITQGQTDRFNAAPWRRSSRTQWQSSESKSGESFTSAHTQ